MKLKRKAAKGEQLTDPLQGELATYQEVGLFQRSLNKRTAYRYRGVLLLYQKALEGKAPTVENSMIFLGHLREQGYSPSTLRIYRAALKGYHLWRGENLVFPIKVPHHNPPYIEADLISRIIELARDNPRDELILRLMAEAGLRRDEAVQLRVKNVGEKALRIRGKGDRDRTVPMTGKLITLLNTVSASKNRQDYVLGIGEGAVYRAVKKYGRMAGSPETKPHDLRHSFATRLLERGVNIRAVQDLMGHSDLNTTRVYIGVSGRHLEEAIRTFEEVSQAVVPPEKLKELLNLLERTEEGKASQSMEPAEKGKDDVRDRIVLTMLEEGRRVINDQTGEYARLVKFRLGNPLDKIIIVENLCLEIMESEMRDFGPGMEGRITTYHYDMELPLEGPGEYKITEDKFKLAGEEVDDFEVLCTARPGLICRARVKVGYSLYPDARILTESSEPFYLTFPRGGEKKKLRKFTGCVIGESMEQTLDALANCKPNTPEGTELELCVYLSQHLPEEKVREINKMLTDSGVTLSGDIQQVAQCLHISFKSGNDNLMALANMVVPCAIGWQLIDREALKKEEEDVNNGVNGDSDSITVNILRIADDTRGGDD